MSEKEGIDVSTFQGTIDWSQVATEKSFVIVRAGYGNRNQQDTHIDPRARGYITGAKEYNIAIAGIYWYTYATSPQYTRIEAQRACQFLREEGINVPVFFDYELHYEGGTATPDEVRAIATAFIDEVINQGFTAGIYFDPNYYTNYYGQAFIDDLRNRCKIWYASWYVQQPTIDCDIWQYSDAGTVAGITGNVDLNKIFDSIHYINSITNRTNRTSIIKLDGFYANSDYILGQGVFYNNYKSYSYLNTHYNFTMGITQPITENSYNESLKRLIINNYNKRNFRLNGLKQGFNDKNSFLLFKTNCSNYFEEFYSVLTIPQPISGVHNAIDYIKYTGDIVAAYVRQNCSLNIYPDDYTVYNVNSLYNVIIFYEWEKPNIAFQDSKQQINEFFYYFKWAYKNHFLTNRQTEYYIYDEISGRYRYYLIDINKIKFGIKCSSADYIYWNDRTNDTMIWSDNNNIFVPDIITNELRYQIALPINPDIQGMRTEYVDLISYNKIIRKILQMKLKPIYYSRVF